MTPMTVSNINARRIDDEGSCFQWDPEDLPPGAKVRWSVDDMITSYGILDNNTISHVFATHHLWGPSDAFRGQEIPASSVSYEYVSDEDWIKAADNV